MLDEACGTLDPIDIIIPVYRGESETRTCIESVLASRNRSACEVIVIDDASPEPSLAAWLLELAHFERITLIVHAANRGFVATANEGMALHPERDVVLLNSDTEVADGWVDRLAAHRRHDGSIGTITPFSSNATICSYPRTLHDNDLPPGESTASLDSAFATANAGHCVDIPTAVGFCMYIARECLEKIGPFDEGRYGAGYGEEVDFCMRAARAGFRNVLATDVFVRHVGEVSFGDSGADRRLAAQATVDSLYPEFQARLRKFLDADGACDARRRADLERLRRSRRARVVFATGALGEAGEQRANLFAAAEDDAEVLLLQPHGSSHLHMTWVARDEELALWFSEKDAMSLNAVLDGIGVTSVALDPEHPPPRALQELPTRMKRRRDDPVRVAAPLPHLRGLHLRAPVAGDEADRRFARPLRALSRLFRRH